MMKIKKQVLLRVGISILLGGLIAAFVYLGKISTIGSSNALETSWETLYKLNYRTGKAPDDVKKLHNSVVKLAGYIVPLSDNYSILDEFLLVPNGQACIHVPPPPPNLIVHVKLDTPIKTDRVFNPSWVTGNFQIETTESHYGKASYKMNGAYLEKYDWRKEQNE